MLLAQSSCYANETRRHRLENKVYHTPNHTGTANHTRPYPQLQVAEWRYTQVQYSATRGVFPDQLAAHGMANASRVLQATTILVTANSGRPWSADPQARSPTQLKQAACSPQRSSATQRVKRNRLLCAPACVDGVCPLARLRACHCPTTTLTNVLGQCFVQRGKKIRIRT